MPLMLFFRFFFFFDTRAFVLICRHMLRFSYAADARRRRYDTVRNLVVITTLPRLWRLLRINASLRCCARYAGLLLILIAR